MYRPDRPKITSQYKPTQEDIDKSEILVTRLSKEVLKRSSGLGRDNALKREFKKVLDEMKKDDFDDLEWAEYLTILTTPRDDVQFSALQESIHDEVQRLKNETKNQSED